MRLWEQSITKCGFNAPVRTVFEAISTPVGVSGWWDKQTVIETVDGIILEHNPPLPDHGKVQMKVLKTDPNSLVEWECVSEHSNSSPASGWTGTHCIFELHERAKYAPANTDMTIGIPAQTILDFRQTGYDSKNDFFGFCSHAWATTFEELKTLVEQK